MGVLVKGLVKYDNGSASFEAISSHFEFVHGVGVQHVAFEGRAVGGLGQPHVEVSMAASFKEDGVVAVAQVSQLVDHVKLMFGVQLGLCWERRGAPLARSLNFTHNSLRKRGFSWARAHLF